MPRLLRISSCMLSGTLALGAVGAQELPLRIVTPASSCQFDTASFRHTSNYTLFLAPPRSVPEASKHPESYTPYIHAIASTFEQPPRLTLVSWPGTDYDGHESQDSLRPCRADEPWCDAGPLDGEVQFRLEKGRLKGGEWRVKPDSPEAARAIEQAIRAADSLRLFPVRTVIPGLAAGTVRLGLRLDRRQPRKGGVPIGRIRLPYIRISAPVEVQHQPTPDYPAKAGLAGVTGRVTFEYVIAEDGRVTEGTVRVLELSDSVFLGPAKRAILASQFKPARVAECPVKMLVHQRVVFRSR